MRAGLILQSDVMWEYKLTNN